MKKYIAITIIMIAGAYNAIAQNKLKIIKLTDADSNKTIQVVTGQEILLTLVENPSTGFSWAKQHPDVGEIKLLDDK